MRPMKQLLHRQYICDQISNVSIAQNYKNRIVSVLYRKVI